MAEKKVMISTVIPSYKCAHVIERFVNNALLKLYNDPDLIIVDNAAIIASVEKCLIQVSTEGLRK
jgi:D-tyrosyl-tRNA(Tyr) deacylase